MEELDDAMTSSVRESTSLVVLNAARHHLISDDSTEREPIVSEAFADTYDSARAVRLVAAQDERLAFAAACAHKQRELCIGCCAEQKTSTDEWTEADRFDSPPSLPIQSIAYAIIAISFFLSFFLS